MQKRNKKISRLILCMALAGCLAASQAGIAFAAETTGDAVADDAQEIALTDDVDVAAIAEDTEEAIAEDADADAIVEDTDAGDVIVEDADVDAALVEDADANDAVVEDADAAVVEDADAAVATEAVADDSAVTEDAVTEVPADDPAPAIEDEEPVAEVSDLLGEVGKPVPKQTSDSTTSVKVEWDAVSHTSDNVWYVVEASLKPDFKSYVGNITFDTISYTSKYISKLSPGKTYYVRVGAAPTLVSSKIDSRIVWSDPIKVVTRPEYPSNVGKMKQIGAAANKIKISWPKCSGATHYKVIWHKPSDGAKNAKSKIFENVTEATITGLKAGTKYSFEVTPIRKSGSYSAASPYSSLWLSSRATLPKKPATPTCTYFQAGKKGDYATFKTDPLDNVDGYQIYVYNNKGKKILSKSQSGYSFSLESSKLKGYQFVSFKVRGFITLSNGKKKYGPWSNKNYRAKLQREGVTLSKKNGKLKVSYGKMTGATSYTIYVANKYNGKYKKYATTKKNSVVLSKITLKKGKNYYVRVVANKKVGKKTYKSYYDSTSYSKYAYCGTNKKLY